MPRDVRLLPASRRALLTAALVAVFGAMILPASGAQARSGPCLPDYPHLAQCHVWDGTVRSVNDGDTLDAYVKGDGRAGVQRVRFTGINATELTSYRAARRAGECHAVEATRRVDQLVRRSKGHVRLAAFYPESRSLGRRRRLVAVRKDGRWRDVGRILVSEGLAVWMPNATEDAPNARYAVLAQQAAAAQRGLFSPDACGIGPEEGQPIGLWAQWDADGPDGANLNGEYVKIRNYDPVNWLPLGGWTVRNTTLNRYTFPSGAAVAPGGSVTIHAGEGEAGAGEYFWNQTRPALANVSPGNPGSGGAAYLFDPQGDIRASMLYPCRVGCTNPAQGQISLGAQPRGDEYVSIANTGGSTLDLEPYVLKKAPLSYAFPAGTTLGPGQTLRVHSEGDPAEDTATDRYWGRTGPMLSNDGDVVTLSTYNDIRIACTAYGSRSC